MHTRIKELRKYLKLNQTDFAKQLGMSIHGIQKWEYGKGNIKESSLRLIEQTFNVNPSWLREGKGEMFPNHTNKTQEYTKESLELLETVIEIIDEVMTKYDIQLDSGDKARFISQTYKFCKINNVNLTEKDVLALLKIG